MNGSEEDGGLAVPARGEAHGKVILLGEHAVVHGAPALAVGLLRGARATVRAARPGAPASLALGGRVTTVDGDGDLAAALRALLDASGVTMPVEAALETDLPAGAGLGASAALGVALARALAHLRGEEMPLDALLARALAWERVFHGNPSGIDAAVAARGGCLRFQKGAATVEVLRGADLHLCVGHSGATSSTRVQVEAVARLGARNPELLRRSVEGIAALVENARLAVEAGDVVALGRLLDLNQMLLAGLMVSTEAIERLCRLARDAGAAGAKLTGAGGGGCVVALLAAREDEEAARVGARVLAAWRGEGFDGFATTVRASRTATGKARS